MSAQSFSLDSNSIQAIDRLIRSHRDEMSRMVENVMGRISGTGLGSSMGFGGMRRGDSMEDYKKELESITAILKNNRKTLTASEQYTRNAVKRELEAIKRREQAEREATEATEANTDAEDENTEATRRNRNAVQEATDQIGNWARGIAAGTLSFNAVTRAVNEFEQAYKTGLNWNALSDTIHSAFTMGLSPKDMMDFQAKFRRVSNTFGNGIQDFTKTVAISQNEWMKYTGNQREAAFMQGEFMDVALSTGISVKDLGSATVTLFDRFKKLQAATSITAEQFIATQRSMLAEQSVRDKLVGLQQKERLHYMAGLTQTNMAFRMMGMQEDVADRLVKFIEQQSTKDARSRLKEGAQLSVIAQSMGMDAAAANRLGQLHRMRNKSTDEQKEYAMLGQALKEATEETRNSGTFNQGIASGEYLVDALQKISPVLAEIGNASTAGILTAGAEAQESAILKQQAEIADRNEGMQGKIIESIVKYSNIFSAWGASALAALVGGSIAAGRWGWGMRGARGAGAAGGAGGPGAGGLAKGVWGSVGRFGKAGLVGIGVGLAGAGVQALADPQSEQKKNLWSGATNGAALGATAGMFFGPFGAALGAAAGGALGFAAGYLENEGMFDDAITRQKKAIVEQNSAADLKYKFEQDYYQKELDRLDKIAKTKEGMDDAQLRRYNELKKAQEDSKKQYESANAQNAANSFAYEARNIVNAQNSFKDITKEIGSSWGFSHGTTDDINKELKNIQSRLAISGVSMSDDELRTKLASNFQQVLMEKNINTDDSRKTWEALQNGTNYDYANTATNPLIAEAMSRMTPEIVEKMNNQLQASVAERFTSIDQLGSLQANIDGIQKQVAEDKAMIDLAKTNPHMAAMAEEATKRLEENQQLAGLLQQLVNDKTVQIDGDSKDLLTRMAESLDKIAGGRTFNNARSRA